MPRRVLHALLTPDTIQVGSAESTRRTAVGKALRQSPSAKPFGKALRQSPSAKPFGKALRQSPSARSGAPTVSLPSFKYRAAGSLFPGQGHMGRGVAIRLADKKPRPAPKGTFPTFTHDFTDVTAANERSVATWTPSL